MLIKRFDMTRHIKQIEVQVNTWTKERAPILPPAKAGGPLGADLMDDRVDRFFLDCDNSGHWYLVPVRIRPEWNAWLGLPSNNEASRTPPEWNAWLDLPSDNEASWTPPVGVKRLDGGPQAVTFERPLGGGV